MLLFYMILLVQLLQGTLGADLLDVVLFAVWIWCSHLQETTTTKLHMVFYICSCRFEDTAEWDDRGITKYRIEKATKTVFH